ncbi:dienelactone hydrolase family protein [Salinibacterium sp. ZJ450]|uniref:dienelactone hydrolase family protein n=1 Tax=Salinibacterium sp. ZJ450 TaxID=2708338 RepID=UPI0014208F2D|nr:alpha/beta fold hydrolase [Salinibacterium sp. ZJ450]
MALVTIDGSDGPVEAWLARPDGGTGISHGVLMYMDAIGLRPRIFDMADRIASWGYAVLVPNVFYRSGTVEQTSPHTDLRAPGEREVYFRGAVPRMDALTSDLSRKDTTRYLEVLRELTGSDDLAVVGYCMGVRLALRAAGDHPDLVGAVAGFHGGALVTGADDSPHLSLATARAGILLRHADQDRSMPAQAMATIVESCQLAGLDLSQDVYTGAPHGYSMADTSMYDEGAAERHFRDLRAHLEHTRRPALRGDASSRVDPRG